MNVLRRLLAIGLLCGGVYLLYTFGLGRLAGERLLAFDGLKLALIDQEIPVDTRFFSSEALVTVAEYGLLNPIEPEAMGRRALSVDPTSGKSAAFLLSLYASDNDLEQATPTANLAGSLWPSDSYTHSRLADFWIAQNKVERLVPELNVIMIRDPITRSSLFPLLANLTVDVERLDLLEPYIASVPAWWLSFFRYVDKQHSVSMVRELFDRRVASGTRISAEERLVLLNRLKKEQQHELAYAYWRDGLSKSQLQLLENGLYDGGFDGEVFNQGFGWTLLSDRSVQTRARATYGVRGRAALRVAFRQGRHRVDFKHVSQSLMLPQGQYQLSFRARRDSLNNTKGLAWRVYCESGSTLQKMAEGPALKGSGAWEPYEFTVQVPAGCERQLLRLEAVSRFKHDHIFSGQLWIDEVRLMPAVTEEVL